MSEISVGEFLRTKVYPKLDAVQANLFDNLEPKMLTGGGSYPLICPACKAKEGYYFPYGGYINCPRKNECGQSTSIWDAMLACGYSHSEIFKTLCEVTNVEPPRRGRQPETQSPGSPTSSASTSASETRIGTAIWNITQRMAAEHPSALSAFQKDRGYTDAQMAAMQLGYYTNAADVLSKLKAAGFSQAQGVEYGYLEEDDRGNLLQGLSGRIIGYWPHPDGENRIWGRLPTGSGDKQRPKYKFGLTLKKDIPYLFNNRKRGSLICVEGTMDAWALQIADLWGCAIGGSQVNQAQAQYIQKRGLLEVIHMVDGDTAGWNGAIGSIRNCEALGIVVSIVPLGAGMDDADKLVRQGKSEQLHELVEQRLNAGKYLALMLRSLYNAPALDLQAINRIYAAAENLTPHSGAIFKQHVNLLGLRPDLRLEAGRVFGNLLRAGVSLDEAISNVARRTGYMIKIEKEEING